MRRNDLLRWCSAALLLALLLPSREAEAVIPSAFGPIQALLVILPQLLLAFALGVVALFKPRTYQLLFAYLWAHKALSIVFVGLAVLGVWGVGRLFTTGVSAEKTGGAWSAFRGGPSRTGSTPGAKGPRRGPRTKWHVGPEILGSGGAVDSSPAVVGNRVYFGSGVSAILGSSAGAIHAIDLDSGGRAWSWTGAGELPAPLRPVFSSPAVDERYLVCGEGYHDDRDCRLVVLDLEPVRASEGKQPPKLHGWVQTTSHVESSPAIHEGRVYAGAGDDGFYCFDLAAGKVAWRIEGDAHYEIAAGPQAEALAKLAGKTVAVTGTSTRVFTGETPDANLHVLRVTSFREHDGPATPAPGGPSPTERVVIGKIVPAGPKKTAEASAIRLETALSIPDCESSPVIAGGKVVFGSGIGGNAVVCADAKTGAVLWKSPVAHPAFGAPTVVDDSVLIGLGNGIFTKSDPNPVGAIVALSLADGKPRWSLATGDVVLGAVAVDAGRGYAGSRDGHVYVVDVKDGKLLQKIPVGAPMVCSPALAADAVFFTTDAGKLLCVDRASSRIRWSYALAPGTPVISSPVAAGDRLLVGTNKKGFFALVGTLGPEEAPVARSWSGPGGGPDRRGTADDKDVPALPVDKDLNSDPKWTAPPALARPVSGPLAGCAGRVYAPFQDASAVKLAAIEASSGRVIWEVESPPVAAMAAEPARLYVHAGGALRALDAAGGRSLWGPLPSPDATPFVVLDGDRLYAPAKDGISCLRTSDGSTAWTARPGALIGAPAAAHDLILASTAVGLLCLSAENGGMLWTSGGAPLGAPSVSGGRVYAAFPGQGKHKTLIQCRSLADGGLLWSTGIEEHASGHAAVSEEVVAVPGEGTMTLLSASSGRVLQQLENIPAPVPAAIARDLVVIGAAQRIAAYDAAKGEWMWNYKDQDHVGRASSAPVVVDGSVWVGTSARGLVVMGLREAGR